MGWLLNRLLPYQPPLHRKLQDGLPQRRHRVGVRGEHVPVLLEAVPGAGELVGSSGLRECIEGRSVRGATEGVTPLLPPLQLITHRHQLVDFGDDALLLI